MGWAAMSQILILCCNKDDYLKEIMPCWIAGSSRPEVFYEKGILQNFSKFTGKLLCQTLLFAKLQASGLQVRDSGTGVSLWILKDF